jgi:hypothetical protein
MIAETADKDAAVGTTKATAITYIILTSHRAISFSHAPSCLLSYSYSFLCHRGRSTPLSTSTRNNNVRPKHTRRQHIGASIGPPPQRHHRFGTVTPSVSEVLALPIAPVALHPSRLSRRPRLGCRPLPLLHTTCQVYLSPAPTPLYIPFTECRAHGLTFDFRKTGFPGGHSIGDIHCMDLARVPAIAEFRCHCLHCDAWHLRRAGVNANDCSGSTKRVRYRCTSSGLVADERFTGSSP